MQGVPSTDADGNMLDANGEVVNRDDYDSIDDYLAAIAFEYPKSKAVVDLTGDTFTVAVEMQGSYISYLPYTVAYEVIPTDASTGVISLLELDRNGVKTGEVLGEVPYWNYDGETCAFDLTIANLVDFETESGEVTATLVPADQKITIGGGDSWIL